MKKTRGCLKAALVVSITLALTVLASTPGEAARPPPRYIEITFNPPYSHLSGYYPLGTSLTIPEIRKHNIDIIGTASIVDDSGFDRSLTYVIYEPVNRRNLWSYCCENAWIMMIGLAAVMSYRFFSGRAADFQDSWDEFVGKK